MIQGGGIGTSGVSSEGASNLPEYDLKENKQIIELDGRRYLVQEVEFVDSKNSNEEDNGDIKEE